MTDVRTARHAAVCGNRDCLVLIYAGAPIVKPGPGRAWQHASCARAGQRRQARRAARRRVPVTTREDNPS